MCIEAIKEELIWTVDKQFWLISIVLLLKTVIPLKNKSVLSLKYFMHCYVVLSNHVVASYVIVDLHSAA